MVAKNKKRATFLVAHYGTRRPRQYFSRDAPRASAKTMGDVIQKGQPQKVGRKMLQCRRKFEDFTIFAKDLKTHLNMLIPQGNSKEELNQRQEIISQVYRKWTEENPDKRVYNRSLKDYINVRYLSKKRNRQVGSLERSSPNFGRLTGLFPY